MVWLINSHWPIVFANLLFAEYPRDMHWRILSGVIPPPLSVVQLKESTQRFEFHDRLIKYRIHKLWSLEQESGISQKLLRIKNQRLKKRYTRRVDALYLQLVSFYSYLSYCQEHRH